MLFHTVKFKTKTVYLYGLANHNFEISELDP